MHMLLTIGIVLIVSLISLLGLVRFDYVRTRNGKADGSYGRRFVFVEENGTARLLAPDEVAYLNTEFHPNDGARPYIKSNYAARTSDGRISGFLLKTKLPRHVVVKE